MRKIILYLVPLVLSIVWSFYARPCSANNVDISNVELTKPDSQTSTINIQFDIKWENSWKNNTNHDAVWVFVKYTTQVAEIPVYWHHAKLKTSGINPAGFSRGTGTDPEGYQTGLSSHINIIVPEDRAGCFIQRADNGYGTLDVKDVELVWDWSTAPGVSAGVQAQVKVFGLEMVYIPEGQFYIGDGNIETESTWAFHVADNFMVQLTTSLIGSVSTDSSKTNPDDAILKTQGIGIDGDNGLDINNDGDLDDAGDNRNFPTGYKAFYIMKYELSQGQYRDFLNHLLSSWAQVRRAAGAQTASQYVMSNITTVWLRQVIRAPASVDPPPNPLTGYGCDYALNGSKGDTTFDNTDDGEWIALNYVLWQDLCAYADWSGLRPMTELEFEKACRGTTASVLYELAHGSIAYTVPMTLLSPGQKMEESVQKGEGLISGVNNQLGGPVRVGFAATATTTRKTAAATYYGVMEMSGNVSELCVTLGITSGRSFQGTHGDGLLYSASTGYAGDATNSDWPGYQDVSVKDSIGFGMRGGHFNIATTGLCAVSDRVTGTTTIPTRSSTTGIRLARTAPTQPS